MSHEIIPERINPFRFAEARASMHGVLLIKDMQRLRSSLAEDSGQVDVKIQFGTDEEGVCYLQGHIQTELVLQCQRCMKPFSYAIIGDFLSGVVQGDVEAKQLSEVYDPVFVEDNMLSIQDIVEDELIISVPIVPMHDPKECEVQLPKVVANKALEGDEDNNPFKVIEILRSKNRNKE